MDKQTRRDVDEACLRLLGWELSQWCASVGKWEAFPPRKLPAVFFSPLQDPAAVVPLAEAMRARGWHVVVQSSLVRPGQWEVVLTPNDQVYQSESDKAEIAFADTLPEALALAAARAVGTETKE